VCGVHRAQGDEEREFLDLASEPRATVSPGFGLKTGCYGFCGLVSKQLAQVFWFGSQNWQLWVDDLAHKITATVSWFGSQNQVGYSLSTVPQNRREDRDDTRHATRSSGLLRLEASRARISQSSLKTGGGTIQIVHVTSLWRLRGDETEDKHVDTMGCIRLFYPNSIIFIVLDYKSSLVISFPINRTSRVDGEVSIQPSLFHLLVIVAF
jgi:hypothetical protein